MIGAIIGDTAGSVYEFRNIKTKQFELFSEQGKFTDDTVMTIAVADAIMNGGTAIDFVTSMKKWGRKYPWAGYGQKFFRWLASKEPKPYNSWGNGSAMRVSPCAEYAFANINSDDSFETSINKARELAGASAAVTHNHPEGIKGAEATAYAMMMVYGKNIEEAKKRILKDIPTLFNYDLSKTLDEIRPDYMLRQPRSIKESCQETVPQAITAFLESTDFEDAIRNAISLGGDSDTLAAITGSIAEAAYGVPDEIRDKALSYLDAPLREVCDKWERWLQGI
jgi:ADP-ribosylglycohydrolase